VAVAKFAWHGRERLGLLRVRGDVIALHGLLWPDEIRDPAAVAPASVQMDDDEIDQAVTLIEAMTRDDITGPEFTDRYTEALHEVIEAKQEGHRLPEAPSRWPGRASWWISWPRCRSPWTRPGRLAARTMRTPGRRAAG
jgi:DNA end-binding protein Ku